LARSRRIAALAIIAGAAMIRRRALVLFWIVGCIASVCAREEEAAPEGDSTAHSPLRKLMDESLGWEELFADDQVPTPMQPRIVLRWTNNTRGSEDGMTVLYLWRGRPEAVCCVYPWENRLCHEFDSLSRGTLLAKEKGHVAWSPAGPGVRFELVKDTDAPAESRPARLRQMKSLAGQFASTMLGWRSDNADREELRLLPRPLYRYAGDLPAGILDGGVFAFVQGTDPESLLLLEAVETEKRSEWQFAFARRTSGELEGRHQGEVVWHVERHPSNDEVRSTHRVLEWPLDVEAALEPWVWQFSLARSAGDG
jgi:hypothetical protein